MTIREIIQVTVTGGDVATEQMLTTATKQVTNFDEVLRALVTDLRDTMWHHSICVGLAAPQIGCNVRVAVVNTSRDAREDDLVLVNPVVMNVSGKKDTKRESCMSMWGLCGDVERKDKISVRYTDEEGHAQVTTFDGFTARAVQHEIDHLEGIMYRKRLKAGAELAHTDLFDNETWRV